MKKISVLLVFAIFFSLMCLSVNAQAPTLSAEISEITRGEIVVTIYGENIEKLIGLNITVEYDASVFSFKEGCAASYFDEDENEIFNFSGMWSFGELSNGEGCVGAMISYSGSAKTAKTEICRFVLKVTGKLSSKSIISVYVNQLETDDSDYENDIFEKKLIVQDFKTVEYEDLFGYETVDGGASLTHCYYAANCIFIPEKIGGLVVKNIDIKTTANCSFAVVSSQIKSISEEFISQNAVVICPESSFAENFFSQSGNRLLIYKNMLSVNENNIFTTERIMAKSADLFAGDAQTVVISTQNEYCGTGTSIKITNGEKELIFQLAVFGDLNGDSVLDGIDAVLCQRAASEKITLTEPEKTSADLNCDGSVTLEDYAFEINRVLAV